MSEPATTRKQVEDWRRTLMAHPDLTAGAKLTGLALVAHLNFATGRLNPSVDRLSEVTAQCSRSVEKQLKALKAAGLLSWDKKGFRTSNRYHLTIPNSERELSARVSELWAGIGNAELSAGIDTAPTPNSEHTNPELSARLPRTLGGRNLERTLKEPARHPPRTPDGAPGAHGLGKLGDDLLAKHGPDKFRAWFSDAQLRDGRLIAGSPMKANWIRDHYANDLKGLDVIDPERAAALVEA